MSAILQVTDLRKSYAGVHALDGVSLAVEAGSITGLIGPNGSGKSTAIDCISGFQTPVISIATFRTARSFWPAPTSPASPPITSPAPA